MNKGGRLGRRDACEEGERKRSEGGRDGRKAQREGIREDVWKAGVVVKEGGR